jgi:hypothetical protein
MSEKDNDLFSVAEAVIYQFFAQRKCMVGVIVRGLMLLVSH